MAHVRHWFASGSRNDRHDVRETWLEGDHPDTRIPVRWFDRFYGREHVESYAVWSPALRAADGGVEIPSQVGMLNHTWLHESQAKP